MTTRAVSVALTAACSLLLAAAPAGWGATFEVRVNTDQADPKPGDGVCSTVGAAIPPDFAAVATLWPGDGAGVGDAPRSSGSG